MLTSAFQKPTHYRGVHRMDKKITIPQIRSQPYLSSRRCTVNHEESGRVSQTLPMSPPRICTHHRMISYRVTEEEHEAGKLMIPLAVCPETGLRHDSSSTGRRFGPYTAHQILQHLHPSTIYHSPAAAPFQGTLGSRQQLTLGFIPFP
jgi:hypothetical protein